MSELEATVHVVDDDEALRSAVSMVVQSIGVRCQSYASAADFLATYSPRQPGCLVLDVHMPGLTGLQLQTELTIRGAVIPIIFITGSAEVQMAVEAMRHGAFNYLQKPIRRAELTDSVRRALELDKDNRSMLAQIDVIRERIAALTPKEREVMNLVVRGLSNKEVAQEMKVSHRTVEVHRAHVMEKMGATSTAHLVRMFMELEHLGNQTRPGAR
ncbi:MAG TPA: response regulator [Steroidobacteraceae bacterium]|nr:response regulator [Steroidobacteraceae bacterium]